MNGYEPCAWNKEEEGSQLTIAFHVGGLKSGHKNPEAATKHVGMLGELHGKAKLLKANQGKVHECLGLAVGFRQRGEAWASMHGFLMKPLGMLPEGVTGSKDTAAPSGLFKAGCGGCAEPPEGQKKLFHTAAASTLHAGCRARPGAQLVAPFLCARAKAPGQCGGLKIVHQGAAQLGQRPRALLAPAAPIKGEAVVMLF